MKNLLTLIFVLLVGVLLAQDKFPVCTKTYFTNKKVSTKQCTDSTHLFGKAFAYNQKGEVIGKWEISRMHMYSSVRFTFHENGGVQRAEYSSHPDGGIQWYKSTTTYNDKGEKISFFEDSHDRMEKLLAPEKTTIVVENSKNEKQKDSIKESEKTTTEKIQQEEVVVSNRLHSYLWIENTTKKNILITYYDKNTLANEDTVTVKRGETKKIILYIHQKDYKDPFLLYDFKLTNEKGKSKKYKILPEAKMEDLSLQKSEKNYYHQLKK